MNRRATLRTGLLREVSRSFHLSMRVLPGPMRDPVSLGYLLARTSDTLADTAAVPVDARRQCLEKFRALAAVPGDDPEAIAAVSEELGKTFAPIQSHAGERRLLECLPEILGWLAMLDSEDRAATAAVLDEIVRGQTWDLERFTGEGLRFADTAAELETYTQRVAGCVGEFWTRVGFHNLGEKFAPAAAEAELIEPGRALGRGLQLVNILRDLGEDLAAGRCYLPKDELDAAGWRGAVPWRDNEAALLAVAARWRARCREQLDAGRAYVARLRRGRARFATALPLILAERTLDRLDAAGSAVLERKIKISRGEVRRALFSALRA
ncbi:MAG: squalene/phytoene synthase family protein [Verrucomicrobiae bacterium]|nr:squalene/phytoene synthase family protein [Verrucomicrobiae bacterium]